MTNGEWLAERFEVHRGRLRAIAYRMLGSPSDADDAVQEAWLRFSRSDTSAVDNLGAWLTTVVSRVCLNMLEARRSRPQPAAKPDLPEPPAGPSESDPEHEALLADEVGLAMLVVLDTLTPDERVAFVLHDVFAIPFDEIAPIVARSIPATRQLASRARARVRRQGRNGESDRIRQAALVEAFLGAARNGDFHALLAVLDPDVVRRADMGDGLIVEIRGAENVARSAMAVSQRGLVARPALINGAAGWVALRNGDVFSIGALTVHKGRITTIDILADAARLARLDLTVLDSQC
jgi:RNA polymerase sigma-70 factor, ECF subfamily